MQSNSSCLWLILALVVSVLITPILCFLCGWITGIVLNWLIGDTVVSGLNLIFGTTRFTVDELPMICGTLAVIGSFFKSTPTTRKD